VCARTLAALQPARATTARDAKAAALKQVRRVCYMLCETDAGARRSKQLVVRVSLLLAKKADLDGTLRVCWHDLIYDTRSGSGGGGGGGGDDDTRAFESSTGSTALFQQLQREAAGEVQAAKKAKLAADAITSAKPNPLAARFKL
jgi:hypothetical protein